MLIAADRRALEVVRKIALYTALQGAARWGSIECHEITSSWGEFAPRRASGEGNNADLFGRSKADDIYATGTGTSALQRSSGVNSLADLTS